MATNTPRPTLLAADTVVFAEHRLPDGHDDHIITSIYVLLITRTDTGQPALPGGKLDTDETFRAAAARELAEETGVQLRPNLLTALSIRDAPYRDPRPGQRTITQPYTARMPLDVGQPLPALTGERALHPHWVTAAEAVTLPLFGDHAEVIAEAFNRTYPNPEPAWG